MNEVEVKILERKHSDYKDILLKHGFKKVFDGIIEQKYWERKDFEKGFSLRIRTENDISVLTMKERRKNSKAKSRKETNVFIDNKEKMEAILKKIGLHEDTDIVKQRISYKKGNVKVEFDRHIKKYSFIPEFMEIESTNYQEISKVARILGIEEKYLLSWMFKDLVKKYKK